MERESERVTHPASRVFDGVDAPSRQHNTRARRHCLPPGREERAWHRSTISASTWRNRVFNSTARAGRVGRVPEKADEGEGAGLSGVAAALSGGDGGMWKPHYWGREIGKLGHEVKIMPPVYVKSFVRKISMMLEAAGRSSGLQTAGADRLRSNGEFRRGEQYGQGARSCGFPNLRPDEAGSVGAYDDALNHWLI